jgi:hypothetical protein
VRRQVVSVYALRWVDWREKRREEKALIMPPQVPLDGRKANWSHRWGRNDFALILSQSLSLVSCRREMDGFSSQSSASTSLHLSGSFRPRIFQDAIRNCKLIMMETHCHREMQKRGGMGGIGVVPAFSLCQHKC